MKRNARQNKLQSIGMVRFSEEVASHIVLEAELNFAEASGNAPTGREWEVTIIGARTPDDVVTVNGRTYIRSKNGRLYDTRAIAESATQWDGVKVYDNHLTQAEFEAKQGMRSPAKEWLGTIVTPRWDAAKNQLRGVFKVVEDALARKLKNAYEAGVLGAIGLSIDTFPEIGQDIVVKGTRYPVIEGFKKILSVDLVGDPAAGGAFERLIAANIQNREVIDMDKEELKELLGALKEELKSELPGMIAASGAGAPTVAEAEDDDIDELTDEEVDAALDDRKATEAQKKLTEAKKGLVATRRQTEELKRQSDLARTELKLERALDKARLPEKFEEAVRAQFKNRIVDDSEIAGAIAAQRAAYASMDPTGRVKDAGLSSIQVGVEQDERFELAFMEAVMGHNEFKRLSENKDETVKERLQESGAYKSWVNNGKPDLPRYPRMSSLLWEYFGGNPLFDPRASEAATTSSLATVVKNTVNIIAANVYSQKELWFEKVARVEEVDTIDQATLARVYGASSLSTVPEGQAYTELQLADEEETASFVKRGNYIGVTLETLMSDKIGEIRRIPEKLANAWYNTQSDLVANVFTVNSGAGPVLSDTGALFNSTAATSAGGHANLLTAALSHANYAAARLAMRKQTDQILGVGRKLLINPKYLLVPADLEITALNIRNSELVPEGASAGNQTLNAFRGDFEVVVVPPWTDATDFALVADPMQFPAIWLIYPRGMRAPQIFSADNETSGTMFTNDTMRFKARLMTYRFSATYDCAPVSDFRPLHKSNVAG